MADSRPNSEGGEGDRNGLSSVSASGTTEEVGSGVVLSRILQPAAFCNRLQNALTRFATSNAFCNHGTAKCNRSRNMQPAVFLLILLIYYS